MQSKGGSRYFSKGMWSEQDLSGRKLACCDRKSFSRAAISLVRTILLKVLLVRERSYAPPFVAISTISFQLKDEINLPGFRELALYPNLLKISVRMGSVTFTSAFNISAVIPSALGALLLFIALIDLVTSTKFDGSTQMSRSISAVWMSAK
jgi:hypothetical protein